MVAVGAGVRAPVVDVFGVYALDGVALVHLGNAYDDVFEQLSPRVSLEPTASRTAAPRSARRWPWARTWSTSAASASVVGGLVGFGPGGVQLAALRIGYDLRGPWPLFR